MTLKGLRFWKWTFKLFQYLGLFTPLIVVVIMKWDILFTKNKDAFSVTMGMVLVAVGVILLAKVGFQKISKIIWAGMLWGASICLQSVLQNFTDIAFAIFLGTSLFTIFEYPVKYYSHRVQVWVDEKDRMGSHMAYVEKKGIKDKIGQL